MATQQCVVPKNMPTPRLSKADERLARELELFDSKPDDALVSIKLVCAVRERSASSTLRDVKAGRLAPPIKIGPNATRFRVGDVRLSLKGSEAIPNLSDASPKPTGQSLDDAVEQGDPPVIKAGRKKRGGENG